MTSHALPDADHVVRYVRPMLVSNDRVDGSAFRLRRDETGLSTHWLECFRGLPKSPQLEEVRRLIRVAVKPNGCLAELNVGNVRRHLSGKLATLSFIQSPLGALHPFPADPSHAEIVGLPPGDSAEAALIGDMIAECVQSMHPAT